MAATEISICSNGLLRVGAKSIASFNEASDRARLVANLWPTIRDATLAGAAWNCATKRETLAPLEEPPAWDWAYAYQLPDDCLRVWVVGEYGIEVDHKVESGRLLCDATPALVRYTWRNTNPATYDAELIEALEWAIARAVCFPLSLSAAAQERADKGWLDALRRAKAADGQEGTPDEVGDTPLFSARMGMGRWRPL